MTTEEGFDPFCDPKNPIKVVFDDVKRAYENINSGVIKTPCIPSSMCRFTGYNLYLKMECLQQTGSFKERGARNALLNLSAEDKKKGAVAASLGNHSQGMSYQGNELKIPVTVVMPVTSPIMKIQNCRKLNATVVVEGANMAEAKNIAIKLGNEKGLRFINGYDHPDIISGQGTIAIEIFDQVPDAEVIVVPCGGGGLLSGIAVAAKHINPNVKIVSVETEHCASFAAAVKAGQPTFQSVEGTIADGLAVSLIGCNSWETAKGLVDKTVVVKESTVALAILRFIEVEKTVVEGAGACALSAILEGQLTEFKNKKIVLILSGGNIDTSILGRCLFRGLAADGRLVKFKLVIKDRPGGICEVCQLLTSLKVSVKDVFHDRTWVEGDVFSVDLTVVCETFDYNHAVELRDALMAKYPQISFMNFPESSLLPPVASSHVPKTTSSAAPQSSIPRCVCKKK